MHWSLVSMISPLIVLLLIFIFLHGDVWMDGAESNHLLSLRGGSALTPHLWSLTSQIQPLTCSSILFFLFYVEHVKPLFVLILFCDFGHFYCRVNCRFLVGFLWNVPKLIHEWYLFSFYLLFFWCAAHWERSTCWWILIRFSLLVPLYFCVYHQTYSVVIKWNYYFNSFFIWLHCSRCRNHSLILNYDMLCIYTFLPKGAVCMYA